MNLIAANWSSNFDKYRLRETLYLWRAANKWCQPWRQLWGLIEKSLARRVEVGKAVKLERVLVRTCAA